MKRLRISAPGSVAIRGSGSVTGSGIGGNGTERPRRAVSSDAGPRCSRDVRRGGLTARSRLRRRLRRHGGSGVAPLPDRRPGDRRADERAESEAACERRGAFVALVAGSVGNRPDEGLDEGRDAIAAAHDPVRARRVGPRIATIATNPMPTQARTDAATSRKSPIRRRSNPSRSPSSSPAHAPRTAAPARSGSRPPAEPRTSTYSAVWKIPTSNARTGAGPITGASIGAGRRGSPTASGGSHGLSRSRPERRRRFGRRGRDGRFDPAAAEDDVAVVQDRGLARCGGPDRLVGFGHPGAATRRFVGTGRANRCRDQGCPVTDPDLGTERGTGTGRRLTGDERDTAEWHGT